MTNIYFRKWDKRTHREAIRYILSLNIDFKKCLSRKDYNKRLSHFLYIMY